MGNLRCGCVTHRESEDLVGCPVIQVERLTGLIIELEKQVDESNEKMRKLNELIALGRRILAGEPLIGFKEEKKE